MSGAAHVAGHFKALQSMSSDGTGQQLQRNEEGGGGGAAAKTQHAFVLAESVDDQCGLQESTDDTHTAPCCELNFGSINAVSPGISRTWASD